MDMLKLLSAEDISSLALTSWNILQPGDDDTTREEALAAGEYFLHTLWSSSAGASCRRARNSPIARGDVTLGLACWGDAEGSESSPLPSFLYPVAPLGRASRAGTKPHS